MSSVEPKTKFDFMKTRYFWLLFSVVQVILCFGILYASGDQKYSIDFLGGTDVVVQFKKELGITDIRNALNENGLDQAIVQSFEGESKEFSIRYKGVDTGESNAAIKNSLATLDPEHQILKNDFVGPIIGDKIKNDGFKAVLISIIGLLIYIAWRFEFVYGLGAIIALAHDVVIAAGIFVYFGGEIGASALAALLTILGYSINDTIVTYDRIRENLAQKARTRAEAMVGSICLKDLKLYDIVNLSVNQTLARTLLTGGTTLFTCLSLCFIGGGEIAELSVVLAIGIVVGTYSTIFVASPLVLLFAKKQ